MTRILVIDDSPVERRLAVRILEKNSDWEILEARDALTALEMLPHGVFDLVLSDVCMGEMSGLDLLDTLKDQYPELPMILMTSKGSEEMALTALERGAASYLPKRFLARDLETVVYRVLKASEDLSTHDEFQRSITFCRQTFQLGNNRRLVASVVKEVQNLTSRIARVDQSTLVRIGVAVEEALLNAMIHGNLEVSSELRERADNSFHELIRERSHEFPYSERTVELQVQISPERLDLVVRDEGPGFDVSKLPDPTDAERLLLCSGRGILLMRSFMDEVEYNSKGNEVVLRKSLESSPCKDTEFSVPASA